MVASILSRTLREVMGKGGMLSVEQARRYELRCAECQRVQSGSRVRELTAEECDGAEFDWREGSRSSSRQEERTSRR